VVATAPTATPAPAPETTRPAEPVAEVRPPEKSSTLLWVGWGATGALAIGAGVTGFLALKAKSDYDSALATFPGNAKTQSEASSNTKTFSLVADVLGAAAIVVGGLSLYFTLTRDKSGAQGAASPAKPVMKLGVGGDRVFLRGEF
jgi:hypothetical protein